MNIWIGNGRLTKDPETKQDGETTMARFFLAVNDGKNKTTFLKIVCFGKTADFAAQYLSKGKECIIEGRLQCQKWTDKEQNKRETWEIIARRLTFVGGKPRNEFDQRSGYETW